MRKTLRAALSVLLCFAVLFCGGVFASAADVTPFRISCVVNGDTQSARGLCWYTPDQAATKAVIYDASGADITDEVAITYSDGAFDGNYWHKATVTGLEKGATYYYQVGDGSVWSPKGTFTTDDGDDSVRFISVGDPQASSLESFEAAARVLEKATAQFPQPDFIDILGDFTNDCTNEEWDNFFLSHAALLGANTLAPIPGNHDEKKVNSFVSMFDTDTSGSVVTLNGVNYSFDYGPVHVAVVNTNDLFSISSAQLGWLKRDMQSTDRDWKIVMMHKAPYSLGKDGKWPDAQYLQEQFAAVCDETNVDVVMCGHDHMYLRTKPLKGNAVVGDGEGTVYVLGGTCGTKRYEIRKFSIDAFLPKDFIQANVVQKRGWGDVYDPATGEWTQDEEFAVGGCFETFEVTGGTLTMKTYIVKDAEDGEGVNLVDTMTLTKATGQNEITYEGDNSASTVNYATGLLGSVINIFHYIFRVWLPKFFKAIPNILKSVIEEDTF